MFLYFILGILFIEVVIPLIEAIVTLLLTVIEIFKGKCSLKISQISAEIQELTKEEEMPHRAIGFVVDSDDNYDEEEEDDE